MKQKIAKFKVRDIGALLSIGPILSLIVLCLIVGSLSDKFFTVLNLINVVKQISCYAVLGIGMTFVIVGGGIDLSVGSQVGLWAVVSSLIAVNTGSVALAVAVILVLGALVGLTQGWVIATLSLPPFIVTMAAQMVLRGFVTALTNGQPVTVLPDGLRWFGIGHAFGISAPIFICIVLFLIGHIILTKTRTGRYIFALGSNPQATKVTGINTVKYQVITYVVAGVCAAIASLILTGRLGSALSNGGINYEGDAIAATVVGGTSMSGGEGNLLGTFIGAAIMGVIRNGLNLLQVQAAWQDVAVGAVILFSVILDQLRVRRKE